MAKQSADITPRDLFAAAALTGILSNQELLNESGGPSTWEWAFQLADAMMQQRAKPPCKLHENGYVVRPEDEE